MFLMFATSFCKILLAVLKEKSIKENLLVKNEILIKSTYFQKKFLKNQNLLFVYFHVIIIY